MAIDINAKIDTIAIDRFVVIANPSVTMTPAEIVIDKCGGYAAVARICGVDLSRVYRWTYPRERGGTGGLIPSKHQASLLREARTSDLDLRPADFFMTGTD